MESGGFGRFRPRGSNPCARTSKPLKSFIAVRGSRTRTDSRARQRWASQIVVLFCSTRRIGSVPVGLQSTPSADDRFLTLYVRSQNLEGQLRVDSTRSPSRWGTPAPCALRLSSWGFDFLDLLKQFEQISPAAAVSALRFLRATTGLTHASRSRNPWLRILACETAAFQPRLHGLRASFHSAPSRRSGR
jgi:hypothetical protein